MTRLTVSFTPDDIRLPVFVGLSMPDHAKAAAAGLPIPNPIVLTAVLDTGANVSAVSPAVVRQLGLLPVRLQANQTASALVRVRLFEVSVGLATGPGIPVPVLLSPQLLVTELLTPNVNFDVIFGLDLLLGCQLFIDGPARTCTLDV